ncbi:aldehyde dehydrogenase family protein [Solitalea longa]|uniref:Aldehyde dehydrogenase n=1 Tax=Solitalea longa TaxID=2079460 RepID=A0A2S5A6Y0_9SPHI|nr:aldehyde dehydrogenase [Solitalea longa]POY38338.1 aldehyde dehydrogenase family protein [Solitalea longa]
MIAEIGHSAFHSIINNQAAYFKSGATLSYQFRLDQLKRLKQVIRNNEQAIFDALNKDLNKHEFESYSTEVGVVYEELNFAIKNLKSWMKPERQSTPFALFPSSSYIHKDPLGCVLIIAPWNYPFQLLINPLIGAIAGGNCTVLKPSELAPATAEIVEKIITEVFDPAYVATIQGDGAQVIPEIMNSHRFDLVFFTGSIPVGYAIAEIAAKKLTPVILELGGKSPCIVDKDVDLHNAAKRIVWGKFTNAGQTCVAPDYLMVHNSRKKELIELIKKYTNEFYTETPSSGDYGRIINKRRFTTLKNYLEQGNIIFGGQTTEEELYIAPTLMENVSIDAPLMTDEIFGPILPVYGFDSYKETLALINKNANPLAFYLFTSNKETEQFYINKVSFGGGCINNTLIHLGNPHLPFGGVGNSGIGYYHGKFSFDAFTRMKAVLKTQTWFDSGIQYAPFKEKIKLLRMFLRY